MNIDSKPTPAPMPLARARRTEQPGLATPRAQRRVGALVFLLCAVGLALLALQVTHNGPATALDRRLAQWLHDHHVPALTDALLAITHLHAPAGIAVLASGLAIYLFLKRDHYWLLAVLLTMPAGMALNMLLKLAFARQRPVFDEPLLHLVTFSFPSGHAAYSTMLYGLLAAYVAHRVDRWRWRMASVFACFALIALIAFSRLYLGAHYLTDVVAGMLEGVGWLALVWMAVTTLRRRQRPGAGY
jgi:membrane-associated phospholipid phosphatase